MSVCLFECLTVCSDISETSKPDLGNEHVACGHGSVGSPLALCSFVDDVFT